MIINDAVFPPPDHCSHPGGRALRPVQGEGSVRVAGTVWTSAVLRLHGPRSLCTCGQRRGGERGHFSGVLAALSTVPRAGQEPAKQRPVSGH